MGGHRSDHVAILILGKSPSQDPAGTRRRGKTGHHPPAGGGSKNGTLYGVKQQIRQLRAGDSMANIANGKNLFIALFVGSENVKCGVELEISRSAVEQAFRVSALIKD